MTDAAVLDAARISRRGWSAAVAFAIAMLFSVSVWAQTTVRELNAQGLEAFAAGRYEQAAELFGRAYALEPQSEPLKNQAVAWYKANRCSNAVESSHMFLMRSDITSDERREIESLLGACKVKLAREAMEAGSFDLADRFLDDVDAMNPDPVLRDRAALVRVEVAKRRKAADVPAVTALDGIDSGEPEETTDPAPAEEPRAGGTTKAPPRPSSLDNIEPVEDSQTRGWPLVGIGSAILAGGIAYHVVVKVLVEPDFVETAAAGEDRARYDRLDRSLRTANILVPVLYGLGGAVAGTGIILVATSPSKPRDSREGLVFIGMKGEF